MATYFKSREEVEAAKEKGYISKKQSKRMLKQFPQPPRAS
jgi:hypothetical protein